MLCYVMLLNHNFNNAILNSTMTDTFYQREPTKWVTIYKIHLCVYRVSQYVAAVCIESATYT